MPKNQKKLYISVFIILIFLVLLFTWQLNHQVATPITIVPSFEFKKEIENQTVKQVTEKKAEQKTEEHKNTQENSQSVAISIGDTTTHLSFSPDTLFYDALVQAKNQGQIAFSGKNYPGLGFFVTDIGTLHAGSGKYLLYYINGKEATVGVSAYTLKDGDIIEWKLE